MSKKYWRYPGYMHDAAPGIYIGLRDTKGVDVDAWAGRFGTMDDAGFEKFAKECLLFLQKTACGDTVLQYLSGKNVMISRFSTGDNSVQYGGEGQNSVAAAIWGSGGHGWQALQKCYNQMKLNSDLGSDGFKVLAHMINTQPDWDLGSQNVPAYSATTKLSAAKTAVKSGKGIEKPLTTKMVSAWITLKRPPVLTTDELQKAKKGLVVALEPFSLHGAPIAQTTVIFNTKLSNYKDRPPAIGLGHELIHAYFSFKGIQPGTATGAPKGAVTLNEYKCVGVGPWDGATISENALRAQWSNVVWWNWLRMTKQNAINPGKRTYYD